MITLRGRLLYQEVTGELFAAYKGEVSSFQPLPTAFEHFGLDFMLDESMHLWLLEVTRCAGKKGWCWWRW